MPASQHQKPLSDIEIAQSVKPRPITDVAKDLGLGADDIDLYGKYKAKVPLELSQRPAKGKLVLVAVIARRPLALSRIRTPWGEATMPPKYRCMPWEAQPLAVSRPLSQDAGLPPEPAVG